MFKLDYRGTKPIYEQIKDNIKELIILGVLKEEEKLPSVRELASNLAINPNTIQKAYKDLEAEGYIYSKRACGCFVSSPSTIIKSIDENQLYEKLDRLISKMLYSKIKKEDIIKHLNNIKERNE